MAIVFTFMFLLVFWVFEIGFLMYTYTVMADAANEGVRYAMVQSATNASFTTNVTNRVHSFASTSLHDTSAITIGVSAPDGDYVPPHRVKVTVTYQFVPYLTFAMKNPPTMSTYSEGPMVVK